MSERSNAASYRWRRTALLPLWLQYPSLFRCTPRLHLPEPSFQQDYIWFVDPYRPLWCSLMTWQITAARETRPRPKWKFWSLCLEVSSQRKLVLLNASGPLSVLVPHVQGDFVAYDRIWYTAWFPTDNVVRAHCMHIRSNIELSSVVVRSVDQTVSVRNVIIIVTVSRNFRETITLWLLAMILYCGSNYWLHIAPCCDRQSKEVNASGSFESTFKLDTNNISAGACQWWWTWIDLIWSQFLGDNGET